MASTLGCYFKRAQILRASSNGQALDCSATSRSEGAVSVKDIMGSGTAPYLRAGSGQVNSAGSTAHQRGGSDGCGAGADDGAGDGAGDGTADGAAADGDIMALSLWPKMPSVMARAMYWARQM